MQQQQRQQHDQATAGSVDIFLTHVPPNLRAKFGRARCRELLADPVEVQRVWNQLTPPAAGFHGDSQQPQRRPPQRLPPLHQPGQDQAWYAVLSRQFNSDYSPGVTAARHWGSGHTGDTHSEAACQRSAEFNTAGAVHKLCRDEFSTYNEIIHVERKFNNYWASIEKEGSQPKRTNNADMQASGQRASLTRTQPQPVSILSGGTAGKSSAAVAAKRVTISEEPAVRGGGQGQQQLHRANTVQR